MKFNAQQQIVIPCSEFLTQVVVRQIDPKDVDKKLRLQVRRAWEHVKAEGKAPSVNMNSLATACGHAVGAASDDEIREWLAGELRCSWFRARCGVANEQAANWSHGTLNVLPITYAAQCGFDAAKESIGRTLRFIQEVDHFRIGRCIATGARSALVKQADFCDPMAKLLRGDKIRWCRPPHVQDTANVIGRDFPEIVAKAASYPLPTLRYPTTITVHERGVSVVTDAPPRGKNRYGTTGNAWHEVQRVEGGFVLKAWGIESKVSHETLLGPAVSDSVTTPAVDFLAEAESAEGDGVE